MKNDLNTCFQQKFATGSYGVGIVRAWCSQKACKICSSLVRKKKLKKNKNSSHKLPKQQSTYFWSQGILGVNTVLWWLLKWRDGVISQKLLLDVISSKKPTNGKKATKMFVFA
jgi:hypothetical protein